MLGAMIGDTVGSRFEFHNRRSKSFTLLTGDCRLTDDSIMTTAVAEAILKCDGNWENLGEETVRSMRKWGARYPDAGYGGRFFWWLHDRDPKPYGSYGNGSAMRVSPAAYAAESLEEAKKISRLVTEVTHNHPEGIKGAEATTVAVFMALHGADKAEIRKAMEKYYDLSFTLDEIRPYYEFNETCQDTVPQALVAFFEGEDFEDCIRCAISVGGDSDTLADITGAIAEAYYGIPEDIHREMEDKFIPADVKEVLEDFNLHYKKA